MEVSYIVSLMENVGFSVTLYFILIRYVLQTIQEKSDLLSISLAKGTPNEQGEGQLR